jgi:hypothetical protein
MHFSQLAIKTWAQRAQPLFRKEEAIARNALEEGNGTKVSQLFIFMHNINVGGWGRGGGDRRGPQRRTGWGVQGGPRVASPRTITLVDHTLPLVIVAVGRCSTISLQRPSGSSEWGATLQSLIKGHQDDRTDIDKMPPDGFHPR